MTLVSAGAALVRRLAPDRVVSRIAFTIVLAVCSVQALTFLIVFMATRQELSVYSAHWLVEELAELAKAVSDAQPRERPGILAARDSRRWLTLRWLREPPDIGTRAPHWPFDELQRRLAARVADSADRVAVETLARPGPRQLLPPPPRPVDVVGAVRSGGDAELGPPVPRPPPFGMPPGPPFGSPPFGSPPPGEPPRAALGPAPDGASGVGAQDLALPGVFTVALALKDGSWLVARPSNLPDGNRRFLWIAAWLLAVGAVVAGLSLWSARWLIRPVGRLAEAASRVGIDQEAPPLPESGPRELRVIVRAFNEMRTRIKRFVDDRMQMVAAMSHDLRTPLTRLRLRAELLGDAELRRKALADIDEMRHMIEGTLSFAREESDRERVQRTDLAALLATLCDDMADAGKPATYAGPDRLAFPCRPRALRRALANLIENAAAHGDPANGAAVTLRAVPDGVEVVVEDSGPGIPEDKLDAVFRPFFRLEASRNRSTGGTGLGLAVARTVARAHGGDVVLRNRAEGGLAATLTLPRPRTPPSA